MNHTTNNRFTISLTKSQLDAIQKQFLKEMDEMLNRVRKKNNNKLVQSGLEFSFL